MKETWGFKTTGCKYWQNHDRYRKI